MWRSPWRLLLPQRRRRIVAAKIRTASRSSCRDQPGFSPILPVGDPCYATLVQLVDALTILGQSKGSQRIIDAAMCIDILAANGKIGFCPSSSWFMRTLGDCSYPDANGGEWWTWCPEQKDNCICINEGQIEACLPNHPGLTTAFGKLATFAAALAHETCHVTGSCYEASPNGEFIPYCAFLINEAECECFEIEILDCFLSTNPPPGVVADLLLRRSRVEQRKMDQEFEAILLGCL